MSQEENTITHIENGINTEPASGADIPNQSAEPSTQNPEQEGFDIVYSESTESDESKKQDSATNALHAKLRIERKRQRELEAQLEAVKRGELPEDIRVAPVLPQQPDINSYLSDEALAKYDYDQSRALAAFNAAQTDWLMKAHDARSHAVAEQGRKTQQFTHLSAEQVEFARKHYDAAEKLNLPDYQEKEDALRQLLPAGIDTDIMRLFPEKSAAIFYHLGANPEKARQILNMDGQQALIELTRLAERLTIKPRNKPLSSAPPVNEPISGNASAINALQAKLKQAYETGDAEAYFKIKKQIEGY